MSSFSARNSGAKAFLQEMVQHNAFWKSWRLTTSTNLSTFSCSFHFAVFSDWLVATQCCHLHLRPLHCHLYMLLQHMLLLFLFAHGKSCVEQTVTHMLQTAVCTFSVVLRPDD